MDELSSAPLLDSDSPRVVSDRLGIFTTLPSLSFDDDIVKDLDLLAQQDSAPTQKLALLLKDNCQHFLQLKERWSQTFAEVEASHILVVKDLQKLKHSTVFLRNLLGKPDLIEGEEKPSVWTGLRHISDTVGAKLQVISGMQATSASIVEAVKQEQNELKQSLAELGEETETFQKATGD